MGHAIFLLLSFSALWEAYLLAQLVGRTRSHLPLVLFAAVAAMSELVLFFEIASFLHRPESVWIPASALLLLVVQGLLILVLHRRHAVSETVSASAGSGLVWLVGLGVSLQVIAYGLPPIYHDGLTYHLTFAVEWLKNGNLNPPIQAYGDLAAPFYPINSSVLYLWTIALSHSDFWTRFTQAPFLILIAGAVLSICQNLQARVQTELVAIATLATVPLLRYAHHDQGNDVILTALLLVSLAFLVEMARSGSRLAMAGFPLAISLAAGTKYVALAYIPLPVCVYVWLLWKRRARLWLVWLTLSLTGLASFSYLRSWYVTGSALYPATFDVPGLRARFGSLNPFQHPYGGLCRSFSEVTDVFGATWFLVAAGALVFYALRIRRGPRPVESLLLAVSALSVVAFYGIVPYRHCRLLLFPLLALVPLFATGIGELGLFDQSRFASLDRALSRHWRALFALTCIVFTAACFRIPSYERQKYDTWATLPVAGRRYGAGWRFIDERERASGPLRIAMSATQNIPYPLYGRTFANAVFFLPRDGRPESLYYGLATRDPHPFQGISQSEWKHAILKLRPDYFFSAVDMNSAVFGKEDAWAASDTGSFSLAYQDPEVRIYKVRER